MEETWKKTYWAQWSRIQWLKAGDRNAKFFHQATVERRQKNKIIWLQMDNGVWIEEEFETLNESWGYYKGVFRGEKGVMGRQYMNVYRVWLRLQ